jgi:phage gp29-like protein
MSVKTKKKAGTASTARGHVVPDLALWNQAARIGGGLTPARIASIVRAADTGDIRQLMDLANECRQRDSHLHAVLGTHEESIAGLPWRIATTDEKPRAKDKRAAKWVDDTLRAMPALQRLIADLAGAAYYSFAVVEIVWRKDGGQLVPDSFVPIAPRRFMFRRTDGALVFQDVGGPEVDLLEAFPNKFISSRPRVTGDVPTREGLCRVLVWMSAMRNWVIGDWLKTGEMSWKPWRIGTYKKESAQREDREDLETILRRMSTDFVAVIPDSTEIKVEWPQGTSNRTSTHGELAKALGDEMSKAVLGQTETTQSSTSSGYGQAKVHDSVRRDLRDARAMQIAADLTRDLIAPMIALNFGESVKPPRFEFVTQEPIDLTSFSAAVKALREAGTEIPLKWVLDQAGIPERKGDEPVLGEGEEEEADGDAEDKPATGDKPEGEEKPEPEDD